MTIGIILVGIGLLWAVYQRINDFDVPDPFECGGDEVCHCEESADCIKRKA